MINNEKEEHGYEHGHGSRKEAANVVWTEERANDTRWPERILDCTSAESEGKRGLEIGGKISINLKKKEIEESKYIAINKN